MREGIDPDNPRGIYLHIRSKEWKQRQIQEYRDNIRALAEAGATWPGMKAYPNMTAQAKARVLLDTLLPTLELRFKDKSLLHKLIGLLLFFNKTYMTTYTTSFFGRIWVPSKEWLNNKEQRDPVGLYSLLKHEEQHLKDEKRFHVLYHLTYLLLPLPLLLSGRAYWEWRAYKVSMHVRKALLGYVPWGYTHHVLKKFTGPDYLYPFPFKRFMRRKIENYVASL